MKLLRQSLVWLGGAALIYATVIDTASAIGRNIDVPLKGSIELVQAAVLVAGSLALLFATITESHARVHLLVDRLQGKAVQFVHRLSDLLTILFVGAVLAGSVWLSVDLWGEHEVSELLDVPWRWLRLFANLSLAAMLLVLLQRLWKRR